MQWPTSTVTPPPAAAAEAPQVKKAAAAGATTVIPPEQARATAARTWDRTPSSDPAVHQANQLGTVFARLDCAPRWRERLGELTMPTLIVHGRADPFFPVGNGEALAAAIPGARLLVLEAMGTALPDSAADQVTTAMLAIEPARPPLA